MFIAVFVHLNFFKQYCKKMLSTYMVLHISLTRIELIYNENSMVFLCSIIDTMKYEPWQFGSL